MLKCQKSLGGKRWPMGLEHGQKLRQQWEETRQANMESERNSRVSGSPRSDKVWCDQGRQGHGILGHSCSGLSQPQAHPSSTIPRTSRPGRPMSSHRWRGWGVSDQVAPARPHICEGRHGPGTSLLRQNLPPWRRPAQGEWKLHHCAYLAQSLKTVYIFTLENNQLKRSKPFQ